MPRNAAKSIKAEGSHSSNDGLKPTLNRHLVSQWHNWFNINHYQSNTRSSYWWVTHSPSFPSFMLTPTHTHTHPHTPTHTHPHTHTHTGVVLFAARLSRPTPVPGFQQYNLWKERQAIISEWVAWQWFQGTEEGMWHECGEDVRWRRKGDLGDRKSQRHLLYTREFSALRGHGSNACSKYIWQQEPEWRVYLQCGRVTT